MAIPKGTALNFETLKRAFASGDVALVECKLNATGEMVDALCMVNQTSHDAGGEYEFVPVAIIPRSASLYDLLEPPGDDDDYEAIHNKEV